MSGRPRETLWTAKPHTIAKIEILSGYLTAYFPILGTAKHGAGQDLLFVDGFAGPGEYTNHATGSPIAALDAAIAARRGADARWVAGVIHLAFIEEHRDRFQHLESRLAAYANEPLIQSGEIEIHTFNCTFEKGMPQVKARLPMAFSLRWPLFVFIDPFGATGVPFSVVAEILSTRCSEVLLNLDADGISRIFLANNPNQEETLTSIFGDESWRDVLTTGTSLRTLCTRVLDLYKSKLRSLPRVKYVFPFEMLSGTATHNYYLVFASQHPLGLIKMKEAMKKISKDGGFSFSDGRGGHLKLFRFDEPEDWTQEMYQKFAGQRVKYEDIRDFALNETPFTNPSKVLALLEKQGLIPTESVEYQGKRNRGAFAPEKTIAVTFAPSE